MSASIQLSSMRTNVCGCAYMHLGGMQSIERQLKRVHSVIEINKSRCSSKHGWVCKEMNRMNRHISMELVANVIN